MTASASELVARGVAAAKENRRGEARTTLERALRSELSLRDMIRAWQYLSEISDTAEEKKAFLGKMLAADPSDGYARRELAVLNGNVNRDDLIDPDTFVLPAVKSAPRGEARSFACPQCGSGGMASDPASGHLVCRHCGHHERIAIRPHEQPRDVAATLWTAKGRSVPRSTTVFECKGCGAAFVTAPEKLSTNCPYCTTAYVVSGPDRRELIEPDGILPFAVSSDQARTALKREGAARVASEIRGIYMPVWMVTFTGEVKWKGMRRDPDGFGSDYRDETSGTYTVIDVRARLAASRRASQKLDSAALEEFDFTTMIAYQPGQLVDWPAETYEVSLEAAVVTARTIALPAIRAEVEMQLDASVENVEMTFSSVAADSFQLVLVPLWLADLERAGARVPVFVNGQSGVAHVPRGAIKGWLSRFSLWIMEVN